MNKPEIQYDEISDTLTISYEPGQTATGIELNEHIILRINKAERKIISIELLDYSFLAQQTPLGPRSFPLTGLNELSNETREIVLSILTGPPLKDILLLSTYTPTSNEAIPITSIHNYPLKLAG